MMRGACFFNGKIYSYKEWNSDDSKDFNEKMNNIKTQLSSAQSSAFLKDKLDSAEFMLVSTT